MGFFISDSLLSFGLLCHFILLHIIILLCKTKSKQKIDQTTPQNSKMTLNEAIILKQPLPSDATPINKTTLKQSSTKPIESEAIVKMIHEEDTQCATAEQKNINEKSEINKTQSETEFEDISLKTSLRINQTQGSISQRMDDSADTGEYVSDLPEDREHSSDE